jgi:acyl carrier protein
VAIHPVQGMAALRFILKSAYSSSAAAKLRAILICKGLLQQSLTSVKTVKIFGFESSPLFQINQNEISDKMMASWSFGGFMTQEMISSLSKKIAQSILKQPSRVIKSDEALISSGLIDSFSLVDLALLVEDDYGVQIDDTELNADTFDTLEQLVILIQSKQ